MVVRFLILVALAFDFMNGFHDAANSIATVVSTRVLTPRAAVVWAAFFNFIAFLFFGLHVAGTIGKGIIRPEQFFGHPTLEGVGQNPAISQNQDITNVGVALNLLVQHSLEGNEIVNENLVGGIQGNGLGGVFHLADHSLAQGRTVLAGDQEGYNQPTGNYHGADRQE